MNEDIKEIFDIKELFEEWKQFLSWCYENNDKTVEIHRDKLKWTMDYITNLQEENEKLVKVIEEAIDYMETHTDKLKNTRIPKIDFNYKYLLNILNKLTELKGGSDE